MNMKNLISVLFILLVSFSCFSQESTKKQIKEAQKIEKQKQIEALVNSKQFVFTARNASPQGHKMIDLTTNPNYVEFQPDFIKSQMPFFGTAFSGVGYRSDAGLNFEGKPEEFTIEKGKKYYQIKVVVKGGNDSYRLTLSVYFEGGATLYINSNNRSSISYSGTITAIKKEEKKH
jgi:Domain of unknown function (DUF4251)